MSVNSFFIRHHGEGLQYVPREALGGFQDGEGRLAAGTVRMKEARHGRCVLSRSLDGAKGTLP